MAGEKKKIFDIDLTGIRQKTSALSVSMDNLQGKIIKLDMAKFLRGKNVDAAFIISKKDDHLEAAFLSINLIPAYIRRMMRKGISWIEDSFVATSKDGVKLQIKPFMISKKKIHRSIKNALRRRAKEYITKAVSEKGAQDMFSVIVYGEFQKSLSHDLKKIYPLSLCEIRMVKTLK